MHYLNLPPEKRIGEHKYKAGEWVLYDDRPTEEQQRHLLETYPRSELKQCPFCNRWITKYGKKYCSDRCTNDAYLQRRRQRHELQLEKVCHVCGKQFHAKRIDAKFCSSACKQAAYRQAHVTDNRSAKFCATDSGNK